MANTFNLGNGNWAQKTEKLLAYNAENDNYKPLPFDFDRASTATRVNKQGLIETVSVDEPRIDFLNNTKGHLLLEPSRSNLITYSEDFSSLNSRSNAVVTSNAVTSPSGDLDADKITFDGTANGRVEQAISATVGQSYTISLYLKNKDLSDTTQVWLGFSEASQGYYITITDEWQRYDIEVTADGTSEYPRIQFSGTGSLYAWGFQVEQGSYPTSIIKTQGSAVTRSADTCNNAGNSTVFNDSEGVLYAEIAALADDSTARTISINNTVSNRVFLQFRSTSGQVNSGVVVGGSLQGSAMSYSISQTSNIKLAIKYKQNDFSLFVNGFKVGTSTGNVFPIGTLNDISFDSGDGAEDFYGNVKDVRVYNTALTDAELIALTS